MACRIRSYKYPTPTSKAHSTSPLPRSKKLNFSPVTLQEKMTTSNQITAIETLIQRYMRLGPAAAAVQAMGFDRLVIYLRENITIATTKDCLQQIHGLCVARHGPTNADTAVNVRVFMAGYMIVHYPANVFEDLDAQLVVDLREAAAPLLASFEQICALCDTVGFDGVPHALSHQFVQQLPTYMTRFRAWKIPDEAKLSQRIRHALTALYDALAAVPPADALTEELNSQIERLRTKLLQIAGHQVSYPKYALWAICMQL